MNGNLTAYNGDSYEYHATNFFSKATLAGGDVWTHGDWWDGNGRSLRQLNGVTQSYFYYDGPDQIIDYDGAAGLTSAASAVDRRYIFAPGGIDEPFLMIDLTGVSPVEVWAHSNHQGSVVATTDSSGNVQDRFTYSPYGQSGGSTTGFPFRYTGQRLDAATDLYFYKARYYHPDLGRFLQTDPIGYGDGMNMYAYVGNNPVSFFDPTGLCSYASRIGNVRGESVCGVRLDAAGNTGSVVIQDLPGSAPLPFNAPSSPPDDCTIPDAQCSRIDVTGDRPDSFRDPNSSAYYDFVWLAGASAGDQEAQWFRGARPPLRFNPRIMSPRPTVPYPRDPTKAPGPGWQWRGPGKPGQGDGAWHNPKTGESLRPDLNHPRPIGPHWDYKPGQGGKFPTYRWFPDGSLLPKTIIARNGGTRDFGG